MENWQRGERISRENNYNILRLAGAAAVMYGHMYVLMGADGPTIYSNAIHALGFKILMILSGYMITQSCIYDGKLSHFFVKRFFRLVPALLFYALAAVFLLGPVLSEIPICQYFSNIHTWRYFLNLIFIPQFHLPGVFAANPYPYAVNGSLWALPIEVFCYILIFLVLKILCGFHRRKEIFFAVTAGLCALNLFRLHFYPSLSFIFYGTDMCQFLALATYFLIGGIFAVTNLKSCCNLQIAFFLLFVSVAFHSNIYVFDELLAMIVLPYALISFGECVQPVFASVLRHTDLTYGLFLWGFAVQQIFVQIIVVHRNILISPNVMFLISFFASSVLAFFTWNVIEKPSASLMKKILAHI